MKKLIGKLFFKEYEDTDVFYIEWEKDTNATEKLDCLTEIGVNYDRWINKSMDELRGVKSGDN